MPSHAPRLAAHFLLPTITQDHPPRPLPSSTYEVLVLQRYSVTLHRESQADRQKSRRELLRQYVHLQHELLDADSTTSAYQASIQAFRQLGYAFINAGLESDLDRLLRLRVIDGGRAEPAPRAERACTPDVHVLKERSL